jgi:hypothetical protein
MSGCVCITDVGIKGIKNGATNLKEFGRGTKLGGFARRLTMMS